LQQQGLSVCGSPFGRQLGGGLFEFRLREESVLLRVFCHACGSKIVLLLSGYDKGEDPGGRAAAARGRRGAEAARGLAAASGPLSAPAVADMS
jgi:hypothetical protein